MAEPSENDSVNETENGGNAVPTNGHKRKIVMLLLPLLLVVGAVVGVYFSGVADSFFMASDKESGPVPGGDKTDKSVAVFYELPEILVNLSSRPGQKPVYFKISISLELSSADDERKIKQVEPRIIDSMQFYLREMRVEELQGSMGTYRLKEELLDRTNKVIAPIKIKDVLFKNILIQ